MNDEKKYPQQRDPYNSKNTIPTNIDYKGINILPIKTNIEENNNNNKWYYNDDNINDDTSSYWQTYTTESNSDDDGNQNNKQLPENSNIKLSNQITVEERVESAISLDKQNLFDRLNITSCIKIFKQHSILLFTSVSLLLSAVANSIFFKRMTNSMPNYPWFLTQVSLYIYLQHL